MPRVGDKGARYAIRAMQLFTAWGTQRSRRGRTTLQAVVQVDQRPRARRAAAALSDAEALDAVLPHHLEVRVDEPVEVGVDRGAEEPRDRDVLVEMTEPAVEQERRPQELRAHHVADDLVGAVAAGGLLMDELQLALDGQAGRRPTGLGGRRGRGPG